MKLCSNQSDRLHCRKPEPSARRLYGVAFVFVVVYALQPVALFAEAVQAKGPSLVTQEIHYQLPEAGEVFLLWGINGWQHAPEAMRPTGTIIIDKVMRTPMDHNGRTFVARITVSPGTRVDYCFLITKKRDAFDISWPLCDGDYQATPLKNNVTKIQSKVKLALVTQEIRYQLPEADEVYLVWGLNGWHIAPEALRPAGTTVKDKVMRTPMIRKGDIFVATVRVPEDTPIDYGFQITKAPGLLDIVYPNWDGDYRVQPSKNGFVEVKGKLSSLQKRALNK